MRDMMYIVPENFKDGMLEFEEIRKLDLLYEIYDRVEKKDLKDIRETLYGLYYFIDESDECEDLLVDSIEVANELLTLNKDGAMQSFYIELIRHNVKEMITKQREKMGIGKMN